MIFPCPNCETTIDVDDSHIGGKGRCPTCATKFVIPENADAEIEIVEYGAPPAQKRAVTAGSSRPLPSRTSLRAGTTQKKSGGGAWIIAVVMLLLAGGGVYFLTKEGGKPPTKIVEAIPEPEMEVVAPEPEPIEILPAEVEPKIVLSEFERIVHPVLDNYCTSCHNEIDEEGNLNLEPMLNEKIAIANPRVWELAKTHIELGSMPPPKKKKQPTDEQRKDFASWVDSIVRRWESGEMGRDPGRTTIRRLNKNEYNYTIRDLVGIRIRPADDFPADGGGEAGFDNDADALVLPTLLMENYVEAAGEIVEAVYANATTRRRYLTASPGAGGTPEEAARKVLTNMASLAYRRPVTGEEVERLVNIFNGEAGKKKNYAESLKVPLLAILISPNFLYRAEVVKSQDIAYAVEDFDLASRLSYFLWSSMPDEELFALARSGELHKPEVLEAQVKRMLADEKSKSLSMHFAGQWLKWEDLRSTANPDTKRFPTFDFRLRVALYQESSFFFENLVKENGSVLDLINSDYTYLNDRLAKHYGIEGVSGGEFRKVSLTDQNRGGILGMGSVLVATSNPLRTNPSARGAYVLEALLGTPPPSPPMDVEQLPSDNRELPKGTTFREALVAHQENVNCKSCHSLIDPLGFGLEGFDPIGRLRTTKMGQPLDTSGVLPDGSKFSGPHELKAILMERRDLFAKNMVVKSMSYALGRELNDHDRPVVRELTDKLIASDYKIHSLFTDIVLS